MKIAQANGKVQTSGGLEHSNFRIVASKKAFEILSSGLYSDKITAIIRELSTNAADSHKAANQTRLPFQVHLPNSLEPYFSVRDYGTGLSDKDIQGLYTTYFDSNRTTSNDFTGCLGLGSKSPFSYVDQFTVESRFNGQKTIYNCFINEQGIPTVTRMHSDVTNEHNGLEVKFAVKRAHFNEFKDKAQEVLSWFKPRPEVTGASDFRWITQEYLEETPSYAITKNSRGKSYVVMGNVAYRVDYYDLHNPDPYVRALLQHGIDLFMDIGSVEVAASREKLSFTQATTNAIKAELAKVVEDLKHLAQGFVNKAKTLWEARQKYYKYKRSIAGQFITEPVVWNNIQVTDRIVMADYRDPPLAEYMWVGKCVAQPWKVTRRHRTDCIPADGTPIVICDLNVGSFTRAAYYAHNKGANKVYLLSTAVRVGKDGKPVPLDMTKPEFKDCGIYEVAVKASELPVPPRTGRTVRRDSKEYAVIYEWCMPSNVGWAAANYWKPVDYDLAKGGVYVEIVRFRIPSLLRRNDNAHPTQIEYIIKELRGLNKEVVVYGIRPSDINKLNKHGSKWISLPEYVKKIQEDMSDIKEKMFMADSLVDLRYREILTEFFGKKFAADSPFKEFIKKIQEAKPYLNDKKIIAYRELARAMQEPFKDDKKQSYLEADRKKIWKQYPLLNYLDWLQATDSAFIDFVTEYICMVDSKNSASAK
jgi:hypothetical protein